jgi:hypothetical protein
VFGVNSNLLSIGAITNKGFGVFLNFENVFLMNSKHNVVETSNRDTMNDLYKFSIPHEVFCDLLLTRHFENFKLEDAFLVGTY